MNSENNDKPLSLDPLEREHYHLIEERLGYVFSNLDWLERALTHRSAHSGVRADYERLEFLGDAVLDLAVAHLLLEGHPDLKEGNLSKMRAALVNTNSLAEIGRELDLSPFIKLSRGELANHGADRPSILADVFEAVFGAIYREAGFDEAFGCARRLFESRVRSVEPRDPKTELQEKLHSLNLGAPEYSLEQVEGPEHAPTFVSVVSVDGEVMGRGMGNTKKGSQQEAAAVALKALEGREPLEQAAPVEELS